MELQFYGADCVTLASRQTRIVIDDTLADLGGKSIAKAGDVELFTAAHASPSVAAKLVIDQPGEYEVSGVSIHGIAARAHIDEAEQKTATIYKIIFEDVKVLVTGHIYPELSDSQLEAIGMVDVMVVPVGGNGYTLDGAGALKLIKKIEPKIVVPTHYEDKDLAFPVPQQSIEQALHGLAMEAKETVTKLKVRPSELEDTTQLIVLERA